MGSKFFSSIISGFFFYNFEKKYLILKNLPNVPTVVLKRFNELFSGVHILTLLEDIQNTFTDEKNKELKISNNCRVIATCKPEKINNLSEVLLSRLQ